MVEMIRHDKDVLSYFVSSAEVLTSLSKASMPTLVSACSVLSGALRYAWLMSLSGRGMYCKVKLLREERAEEEGRPEEEGGSSY